MLQTSYLWAERKWEIRDNVTEAPAFTGWRWFILPLPPWKVLLHFCLEYDRLIHKFKHISCISFASGSWCRASPSAKMKRLLETGSVHDAPSPDDNRIRRGHQGNDPLHWSVRWRKSFIPCICRKMVKLKVQIIPLSPPLWTSKLWCASMSPVWRSTLGSTPRWWKSG